MLKQWLGYIFQAVGVVAALVFSPYLQYGANVRQDIVYFLYAYVTSVIILRLRFRDSLRGLQYAKLFFRFMQWFLAVLASIFAPYVLVFLPFVTLPGVVPKLAISLIVLLLLLFTGIFGGLSELFKVIEGDWVSGFQNRKAAIDYEAVLRGEEFGHQPEPPLTRRERRRKWWV